MKYINSKKYEVSKTQLKAINKLFTHYIFYSQDNQKINCCCTYCNKEFSVDQNYMNVEFKHNSKMVCPMCKHEGILKHTSYGKKLLTEVKKVVVFFKSSFNKVYSRSFYVSKAYNGAPFNKLYNKLYKADEWQPFPKLILFENARYCFTPKESIKYTLFLNNSFHLTSFREPFSNFSMGWEDNSSYYILNIDILKGTFLKYSGYDLYFKSDELEGLLYYSSKVFSFFKLYCSFPSVEIIIKSGFSKLIDQALYQNIYNKRYVDFKAKSLTALFKNKLSKAEITEYKKKLGSSAYSVKILIGYIRLKNAGIKANFDEIENLYVKNNTATADTLINILTISKTSLTRATNYILKQTNNKHFFDDTVITWCDYLKDAKLLKYDFSQQIVYMPKDLVAAHDIAVKNANLIRNAQAINNNISHTEKLKKIYNFEYGKFVIIVPSCPQDIIAEGQALHHCVGGYASRHFNGRLTILFMRDKKYPNTPLYTIEINKKQIYQWQGKNNNPKLKTPQAHLFINEFQKFVADPKAYKKQQQDLLTSKKPA